MKKIKNIFLVVAAATLVACSSEDLPVTHADGWDEITFSVGAEASRADINYVPYDYNRDPHTMGVFGYCNLGQESQLTIFNNTEVTAAQDKETSAVSWSYENKKYWFDYAMYQSFDFFGCMPYNENTTLTKVEGQTNQYKLTMPVEFPNGGVFSPVETALLCAEPKHVGLPEGAVPFRMDQTLSAYALRFQLGDKMDELRDFIIKDVKVYGNGLAYSGNVSRTYTYNTGEWTASAITWVGDVLTKSVTKEESMSIPYVNNPQDSASLASFYIDNYGAVNNGVGALRVTKKLVQWGKPMYIIPNLYNEVYLYYPDEYNLIFEVVYDVVVQNEAGGDVVTRKDVHSTIEFNTENFGSDLFSCGDAGEVQSIVIKIVPDHLYVLADADQTIGYIVVGE